jgi:hypothetical protein
MNKECYLYQNECLLFAHGLTPELVRGKPVRGSLLAAVRPSDEYNRVRPIDPSIRERGRTKYSKESPHDFSVGSLSDNSASQAAATAARPAGKIAQRYRALKA